MAAALLWALTWALSAQRAGKTAAILAPGVVAGMAAIYYTHVPFPGLECLGILPGPTPNDRSLAVQVAFRQVWPLAGRPWPGGPSWLVAFALGSLRAAASAG